MGATIRRCVNSIGGEYPSGLIKQRALKGPQRKEYTPLAAEYPEH